MDFTFAIAIAVTLVGLLLYFITTAKPQEVGRIMFAVGALATLLRFSGHITGSIH